ncbi:MAG: hypothetical protein DI543_07075 [Bradyrhizobium icense]|nr:MAG: hypothetical protein DI543_07075 [Bradyrhizobium icense]
MIMNPRRMAVEMWPTLVFGGGLLVLTTSLSFENVSAVRFVDRLAPSLAANVGPMTLAAAKQNPISADVADAAALLTQVAVAPAPAPDKQQAIVVASLGDPSGVLTQEISSVQAAASANIDPPQEAVPGRIELVGECLVAEACIDQFLWALYERAPKLDTMKEVDRTRVKVKRKGKMVTVTRTVTRTVNNDFTWKDPKAAERASMSMIDYVIGGMDKSFKLKLFRMLYAAENEGLVPGITSAFRDDYRQSLISGGTRAASDRSYHGGSTRGGYGNGMAADIVSTKGATRAQRWVTTDALWKWVDTRGAEYGIGRPYLDRDPPHVGPIDGKEYISKRGVPKTANADDSKKSAGSDVKKRDKQATQDKAQEKPAAKRPLAAKASKSKAG